MFALTIIAAAAALLLTGAVAGTFYSFSVSVMPGLNAVSPEQAIASMNAINLKILNPAFFGSFFGAPLAAVAAGVLLLIAGHKPAAWLFLGAAAVYFLGAFMPTVIVNVPMNEALTAAGSVDDPAEALRLWSQYSPKWTSWNTARALFSGVSLLLVGAGIFAWARQR